MRITIVLVIWFLSFAASAQTVLKLHMKIERVPMNHYDTVTVDFRDILMVYDDIYFCVYTGYHTLILEDMKLNRAYPVYKDILHDEQVYYIVREKAPDGFYIGITPVPPYTRKVWGISLMTKNENRR